LSGSERRSRSGYVFLDIVVITLLIIDSFLKIITERISLSSHTEPVAGSKPPAYQLALHYVRSTNGGKSLLAKGRTRGVKGYNEFFDDQGTMDQERFEHWVGELVEEAMDGKAA
jgi:signal peptidase complex subunit 2